MPGPARPSSRACRSAVTHTGTVAHLLRRGPVDDVRVTGGGRQHEQGEHPARHQGGEGEQPGTRAGGGQQNEAGRGQAEQPERLPEVHGGGEGEERVAYVRRRR
ncbi:hypothetical protein [Streptomyces sp. TE33382]